MEPPPDQFYTGLVSVAYAPLRGEVAPVEPYERFVRRCGEPALEVGCGHGEPLLDLVEHGLEVVGLDSSADMLALCAAEARRRGLDVELICARIQDLDVGTRFAAIYFAGPTFQLVVDLDEAREALVRIAGHLAPGGRALLPVFRPQPVGAAVGVWREHDSAEHGPLAVQVVDERFRPDERRVDTTLRYRRGPADAPVEQIDRVWSLRWYEDGELEALVEQAGLAVHRTVELGSHARSYELALASDAPDGARDRR